jgi:signal transduction histidine kinase
MAFDVHDGPMQDLIAIGYRLQTLRATMIGSRGEVAVDRLAAEFDELGDQLAGAEKTLRSMMFSLEETAAARPDLMTVVAEHAASFKQRSAAAVEVIAEGNLELLTDSQQIAFVRVLQESLSNVAKHASAAKVTIEVRGTEQALLLRICDDGRGFDPEERCGEGTAHIGLDAMRERLRLIGSTLSVESRIGGPTTISAVIEKWRPPSNQLS